jgi:hypothetical protein
VGNEEIIQTSHEVVEREEASKKPSSDSQNNPIT